MSTTAILHVIGAGLAGLAAALAGAKAGWRVEIHEASHHAGGRCRSFFCNRLERVLDNGTHLLLGANQCALSFAESIGGLEALIPAAPVFPFVDISSGRSWNVAPGRLEVAATEIISALGLPWVPAGQTVGQRLGQSQTFQDLWRPLCESMLNTPPELASARLFCRVLREILPRGPRAWQPHIAIGGLSAAFAAPAEATLAAHGAVIRFGHRLRRIGAHCLDFDHDSLTIGPEDRVILAVPAWIAADLLPGLPRLPTATIINAHYLLDRQVALPGGQPFLGVTAGRTQWVSQRDDMITATLSAADALAPLPNELIADLLWSEIAPLWGGDPTQTPPYRVLKERRATLSHTPACLRLRPGHATAHSWLWMAGDWLDSPLPCTMEAAIRSGLAACRLALARDDLSFAC